MNIKTAFVGLVGLLIIAGSVSAFGPQSFAGTESGPNHGDSTFVPPGWAGLAEEQIAKMQEIREQYWNGDTSRDQMRIEMQEYRQSVGAFGPNYIDEDGDGLCDNAGKYGPGSGSGNGQGKGPRWAR